MFVVLLLTKKRAKLLRIYDICKFLIDFLYKWHIYLTKCAILYSFRNHSYRETGRNHIKDEKSAVARTFLVV